MGWSRFFFVVWLINAYESIVICYDLMTNNQFSGNKQTSLAANCLRRKIYIYYLLIHFYCFCIKYFPDSGDLYNILTRLVLGATTLNFVLLNLQISRSENPAQRMEFSRLIRGELRRYFCLHVIFWARQNIV